MKKRLTFQCHNDKCQRIYSLTLEVSGAAKLAVECPFCGKEGVADLAPYLSQTTTVFRGDESSQPNLGPALNLPEIIPTQPSEA